MGSYLGEIRVGICQAMKVNKKMAKGIKRYLQENNHSSTRNISWVGRLSEKMREAIEEYKTIKDEAWGSELLMKLETSKGGIKQGK